MLSRRAFVTLGLFGGAYWVSRNGALWDRFGPLPEFTTEGVPDGFRRLASSGDGISAGLSNPLIGITDPNAPARPARFALTDDILCEVLFDVPAQDAVVRMAYFTDYNCPYCRVLGKELVQLAQDEGEAVHISWHELPLLGEGSVLGARAALAAAEQGAYVPFHKRLNTGIVRINGDYVASIAKDLSLDLARLQRDMMSKKTDLRLAQSSAIAEAFSVIGTPFLLIGRTAVYGRISAPLMRRLIALERSESENTPCG